jgi:hypothetical protein
MSERGMPLTADDGAVKTAAMLFGFCCGKSLLRKLLDA